MPIESPLEGNWRQSGKLLTGKMYELEARQGWKTTSTVCFYTLLYKSCQTDFESWQVPWVHCTWNISGLAINRM